MGLQRTPPPGRPTGPEEGPSQGNTSLPSPSQAFAPRNPRVMRSPQSGSTLGSSSSTRPTQTLAPAAIEPSTARAIPATPAPQHLAPVDEGNVSTTPSYAPPPPAPARLPSPIPTIPVETIPPAPAYPEPEARRPEPTTPSNKRRKSRHPDPPPPVTQSQNPETSIESTGNQTNIGGTSQIEGTGMYGKRYQLMMDTLELAVKNSSHRMTLKEFTKCFPLFAAKNKEIFQDVFESTRAELGEQLLAEATATIEAERFGPALKKIDEAVQEAKENATEHGRPSAWRPELSAKAICAAANFPVYDETYARLRAEYLGLHEDCSKRCTSIAEKKALLKQLESTVLDGVVDLEKTVETMQDFPTEEMRRWMEDVMPTLDTRTA